VLIVLGYLLLSWVFIRWNVGNVAATQVDPKSPDSRFVADWLTEFSPLDPRTHLLVAKAYESTFNADDLDRAVRENEIAASLSPNSYGIWLSLGRSRGLVDNSEGAFEAYDRALALAPNYSLPRWIYGNALIRAGRLNEGFALISAAASTDSKYLQPAVSIALQLFDGNVDEVRRGLGDTVETNAGLVRAQLSAANVESAFEAWNRLSPEVQRGTNKELGKMFAAKLVELKRFRMAASVLAGISDSNIPATSTIANGGFEEEIKMGSTGAFDWRIGNGSYPQIGLSDSVTHSGRYGLLLVFNSFESTGLRSLDQMVPVEPSMDYELEVYFRSDLRSDATLKWQIFDTVSSRSIAETDVVRQTVDWTALKARFRVPEGIDGILLRLVREGCAGPACPMNGRVVFDDISLRRL
jgi:hypothetical protein